MKIIFLLIIFLSCFVSCSNKKIENKNSVKKDTIKTNLVPVYYNYLNDTAISDKEGKPKYFKRKNKLPFEFIKAYPEGKSKPTKEKMATLPAYYLPFTIKKNDSLITTGIDTAENNRYSIITADHDFPVLSNYYLGKDNIRLYYEPSNGRDYIISLVKEKDKIIVIIFTSKSSGEKEKLPDKELTADKWDSLITLLNTEGFWKQQPYNSNQNTLDGVTSVIEAHFKDSYWYVMNNDSHMRKIFDYIILNLAGQKY